jgi:hypothetical protein
MALVNLSGMAEAVIGEDSLIGLEMDAKKTINLKQQLAFRVWTGSGRYIA